MDDTLTWRGRLAARTYDALERLEAAGVVVIPVTAAPAGWCDQMARMSPIDGVIGENGGLHFRRTTDGHGITASFWHGENKRHAVYQELQRIMQAVQAAVPDAKLASDQTFRLASIAFQQPHDAATRNAIVSRLRDAGISVTINNLWILGWLGDYDKLAMACRVLADSYQLDISRAMESVLYVGDSTNDAPMFSHFRHTVGVSTVRRYLSEISVPPAWITQGPGGDGFIEVAEAVIRALAKRQPG